MPIQAIDHFTLRVSDIERSIKFYQEVVGLHLGERPAFNFPGYWLYASGQPILHLVAQTQSAADENLQRYLGQREEASGSGVVDHISLRGSDYQAMKQRLIEVEGGEFQQRLVPELKQRQLFFVDPDGVTIEIIFPYQA
ncbi:VOC family protein [Vibrio sinaloensis]|uniref:VOC family protein n=1 Tax=Photobacterium sp. (strain ATCC 43367) TaxID=379097 RepID=UPI0035E7B6BF